MTAAAKAYAGWDAVAIAGTLVLAALLYGCWDRPALDVTPTGTDAEWAADAGALDEAPSR